jgi:very-long-chain (3R)-3-hydroxyacyl-CoA dehydratase
MGSLSTAYLVAYNAVLAVGWSYVLMLTAYSLADYRHSGSMTLYKDIEKPLKFSQTMAFLEIIHAALGLVRSDVVLTAFQVFSRLSLLWLVAEPGGPVVQQHYGIVPVVLAWTITEIVRYSFYGLSLCGKRPYFLKWCRYTFFIVLWPVGVAVRLVLATVMVSWLIHYISDLLGRTVTHLCIDAHC